jgi:large subunit ribosomal protein L22
MATKKEVKKLNKSVKKKKPITSVKDKKPVTKGSTKVTKRKVDQTKEVETAKEKERIVCAKAKYIPGSARKARLVIDTVRNMNALEAVDRLKFLNKRAALPVRKVIESAIANAYNNFEMEKKDLEIVKAFVDDAPIFKRGRAGSKGRYKKILKRNCHITIYLKEKK